jgi:regulator of extracellular matrix RemA (YlzA/DUF370 family)
MLLQESNASKRLNQRSKDRSDNLSLYGEKSKTVNFSDWFSVILVASVKDDET